VRRNVYVGLGKRKTVGRQQRGMVIGGGSAVLHAPPETWTPEDLVQRRTDIGMDEVIALEEQGFASCLGQCVRKAIAEI
jgi:hypothetical protein